MQFFRNPNIDFMKVRKPIALVSVIAIVIAMLIPVTIGIDWGIDFVGGTELQFSFAKPVETNQIRKVIDAGKVKDAEIKSYGKDGQYLIRVKELTTDGSEKTSDIIENLLKDGFKDNQVTKLGENTIGPKVGKEMRETAVIAVILSVLAILLYIAFRFEFVFGLGATVALIHDVIFTFGFVLVFGHLGIINLEMNQAMLAALLTVLGYSINDTVIVFDRIRENKEKHKGISLIKLINLSINETLSRTVNTVLTTLLVLVTIVIAGGPVLQGFAFTMFTGIIIGTYSSIYIASSFVVWYVHRVQKHDIDGTEKAPKKAIIQ